MFFKQSVLKYFAKVTGKQLRRSFFKYSCSLDVFFIKKGIPAQMFPCEVYKILGTPFYITPFSDVLWNVKNYREKTNAKKIVHSAINKHYSLKTLSFEQSKRTNGNKIRYLKWFWLNTNKTKYII